MELAAEPGVELGRLSELDIDSDAWARFVESQPQATPFHRPEWALALAEVYGDRPFVFALEVSGRVVAGLPALEVRRPFRRDRAIALPFTDHLSALAAGAVWARAMGRALVERSAATGLAIEVRSDLGVQAGVQRRLAGVRHRLRLPNSAEELLPALDRNVRQRLNKLRRGGLEASVGAGAGDLDAFYRLHVETRRRLGVPVQTRRFFEVLWDRMLRPGFGYCVVARRAGVPVAAAVFLDWNRTVVYKYSASDPRHWREAPNHLLLWTAISGACTRGARLLDLGRTEIDNAGLRTFKSEWGATELPLITTGIGRPPAARPAGLASRSLAFGIRRSPLFACRAAGALLYRYFP